MQNFWHGKRVFVTRPRSYLGGWICRELLALGAEVFAFSEPEEFARKGIFDLEGLALKVRLTEGNLQDREVLKTSLEYAQADVVLHLAPVRSLRGDLDDPVSLISRDLVGTSHLMDLLRETGSVRAVVVMSSDKVYSASKESLIDEAGMIEASDIATTSKLCSELLALSYRHQYFPPSKYNKHKIAVATARACTPYGPGQTVDESFIAMAYQAWQSKEKLTLKNPQSLRPWLHIQDLSAGVLALGQALYEKGPKLQATYNLFPQQLHSVQEAVSTLYSLLGAKGDVSDLVDVAVKGVSTHRHLNIAAATRDLGWSPQVSLAEGLKSIVEPTSTQR